MKTARLVDHLRTFLRGGVFPQTNGGANISLGKGTTLGQGVSLKGNYPIIIRENCSFEDGVCLNADVGPITIGANCVLQHGVQIHSSVEGIFIGNGTKIESDAYIASSGGSIKFGENCHIDPRVRVKCNAKQIVIEDNCKIGAGTTINALTGEIYIGERTTFGTNCVMVGTGRGIHIQGNCDFEHGVTLDAQGGFIRIAEFSGCGPYTIIYGHGGLSIGRYCAIAGQCMMIPANHRFEQLDIPIRHQGVSAIGIIVGDDVWIGAQCVILDGAKIGNGCVIGAASVVRGTVPDHSIAVGAPCRVIRNRNANK